MNNPPTGARRRDNCPELERQPIRWIWDGVIAEDAVTLLSAPEKTGKTTLLSLLLDRRREGGRLLGREVRPGRTLLCSEENSALWSLRQPPLDFGPELQFCKPDRDIVTRGSWRRFIDYLLELGHGYYDLLVIDTVMSFLPAGQNNRTWLRWALNEFRVVGWGGVGVLLIHQACTVRNPSRTRGPLAAFADILIDLQVPRGDPFTRRRRFIGVGRYPGTFRDATAELNAAGTDYDLVEDASSDPATAPTLDTLRRLLGASPEPLTRQEILARWPAGDPPRPDSLWRTLARGCEEGVLVRSGAGTKAEAFRYGVAGGKEPARCDESCENRPA